MAYGHDKVVGGNYSDPETNLDSIGYVPNNDRLGIDISGTTHLMCSSVVAALGYTKYVEGIDGDLELDELLRNY